MYQPGAQQVIIQRETGDYTHIKRGRIVDNGDGTLTITDLDRAEALALAVEVPIA
jgi:hypothetical protein